MTLLLSELLWGIPFLHNMGDTLLPHFHALTISPQTEENSQLIAGRNEESTIPEWHFSSPHDQQSGHRMIGRIEHWMIDNYSHSLASLQFLDFRAFSWYTLEERRPKPSETCWF